MFCPECGSLMMPSGEEMQCGSCGATKAKDDGESSGMKSVSKRTDRDIAIIEEEVNTLPTAEEECEKCGHDTAGWWLRQLRSADESETRFFRCLGCGHTWREYD